MNSFCISPYSPKLHHSRQWKNTAFYPTYCLNHSSSSSDLHNICHKNGLRLVLHDTLDSSGMDSTNARSSREGFLREIDRLTKINAGKSIAIRGGADLARAALHIAAEDDSLYFQSSSPIPVEDSIERLDDLSMEFCSLYLPPPNAPPEVFLENLERYFYVHKGFRRTEKMSDARSLYLHSVLTNRSGSAIMLSLIYSEILKTLRVCGFLDFDVEIYHPCDYFTLPSGYQKQKSKFSDQTHILTSKSLLVEILRSLKIFFWPFKYEHQSRLFLSAAHAANHAFYGENHSKPFGGSEMTSPKAAQYRLRHGVWTNACSGNMRRALAACERLIILEAAPNELRDYAVLLYHCGHYEDCSKYLNIYQSTQNSIHGLNNELEDSVVKLAARVNLILAEKEWRSQAIYKGF